MADRADAQTRADAPIDAQSPSPDDANAAAPDQSDLWALYRDYQPELTAYLRGAFGEGPPEPEDVVQEAFQRLAEQDDLSVVRNLRAFLWRTARNLVLTHKRNREARSQYDFEIEHLFFAIEGSGFNPERVLEVKEQLRIIEKTLLCMPEKRRKAFLMRRIDGLNFSAIGRRLGVTRHAIVKHVTRAAFDIETALNEAMEKKD